MPRVNVRTKRPITARVLEKTIQKAAFAFLAPLMTAGNLIALHVPNEARRTVWHGADLKRQGMIPGWPDLDIDIIAGERIFIELKVPPNDLNDNQHDCHALLRTCGFAVYTVYATTAYDGVAQVREILRKHGVKNV